MKIVFGILSVLFLGAGSLRASCGLQGCPLTVFQGEARGDRWMASDSFHYTDFNLGGISGHYTQIIPHLHYTGLPRWTLGGFVPLVTLSAAGESHRGMANPVLLAEYQLSRGPAGSLSAGSQVELAVGDDEHGIASEHSEWVPYLSGTRKSGPITWAGSAGFRWSLSESHSHGAAGHMPLVVNPHEDKELLYRLAAGPVLGRTTPRLFIDGQHVVKGETKGTGFLTGGLSVNYSLSKKYSLGALWEVPLSSPRRFDWHAALTLAIRL